MCHGHDLRPPNPVKVRANKLSQPHADKSALTATVSVLILHHHHFPFGLRNGFLFITFFIVYS